MADDAEVLPLGRLEAFSDGVFAIAITLLVIELGVSAGAESDLAGRILAQWPSYLAYVTSFLTIGAIWMRHAAVIGSLRAADGTLYRLNLVVLLFASFLPYPTRLIGEYVYEIEPERVAVVFYGLALFALSLSMTVLTRYAAEDRRLVRAEVPDEVVREAARQGPSLQRFSSLAFYVIAIAVGLVAPFVAVALYLAIALVLTVPARAISRLVRWRP
jgi:uncharacterized membrane protein